MHLLKGTFTKQKSSLTQVFWEKSHTLEIEFLISFHFEGIKTYAIISNASIKCPVILLKFCLKFQRSLQTSISKADNYKKLIELLQSKINCQESKQY